MTKKAKLQSINPASNEIIWEGVSADQDDINLAYTNAKEAFQSWSLSLYAEREAIIKRYAALLKQNKEEVALLIAKETGKPRWEALTEVGAMINKANISIQAYAERTGVRASYQHRPHGILCVLGPFNFPGHLPNGHIIPALLAGNTIVFKPSELTPAVGEKMLALWKEPGLPSSVLTICQGGREVGEALTQHQALNGVLFTGSFRTGKALHQQFAGQVDKILALEMGGNNPLIISQISDIEAVVFNTIMSAFITAGQRCTCARRLILVKSKKSETFLNALLEVTSKIEVGAYTNDPEPFMGSVIDKGVAKKLLSLQQHWKEAGANILLPLKHIDKNTALVSPGICDVTGMTTREDEEIFGPLLQVIQVNTFEEALIEANNTSYGLAAGLFSDDKNEFEHFYQSIRAGIVNWNKPLTGASSEAPFGGVGNSGNHRPSAYYAADYCAYPVASLSADTIECPEKLPPGLHLS